MSDVLSSSLLVIFWSMTSTVEKRKRKWWNYASLSELPLRRVELLTSYWQKKTAWAGIVLKGKRMRSRQTTRRRSGDTCWAAMTRKPSLNYLILLLNICNNSGHSQKRITDLLYIFQCNISKLLNFTVRHLFWGGGYLVWGCLYFFFFVVVNYLLFTFIW